jgi:hypothetical protein
MCRGSRTPPPAAPRSRGDSRSRVPGNRELHRRFVSPRAAEIGGIEPPRLISGGRRLVRPAHVGEAARHVDDGERRVGRETATPLYVSEDRRCPRVRHELLARDHLRQHGASPPGGKAEIGVRMSVARELEHGDDTRITTGLVNQCTITSPGGRQAVRGVPPMIVDFSEPRLGRAVHDNLRGKRRSGQCMP